MDMCTTLRDAAAFCMPLDLSPEARHAAADQTPFEFFEARGRDAPYRCHQGAGAVDADSRRHLVGLPAWEACRPEPPAEAPRAAGHHHLGARPDRGESPGHPGGCGKVRHEGPRGLSGLGRPVERGKPDATRVAAQMPPDVQRAVARRHLLAGLQRDPPRYSNSTGCSSDSAGIGRGEFRWTEAVPVSSIAARVQAG